MDTLSSLVRRWFLGPLEWSLYLILDVAVVLLAVVLRVVNVISWKGLQLLAGTVFEQQPVISKPAESSPVLNSSTNTPILLPAPLTWEPIRSFDGLETGYIEGVSIRITQEGCDQLWMHGSIWVEQFGPTHSKVLRLRCNGNHNWKETGKKTPVLGDATKGVVVLPKAHWTLRTKKAMSRNNADKKGYVILVDWRDNVEGITAIQVSISMKKASLDSARSFRIELTRALRVCNLSGVVLLDEDDV